MPSKILTQTKNLFKLYRHICGKSEVPEVFHFWSLVSLIAATVENRVWYQVYKHDKLYPNLFIVLIGPSGLGKGVSIGHAVRMAENSTTINKYRGRATAAHLVDYLGKPKKDEWGQQMLADPKLWLIMDELRNDISPNVKMIEDFVFMMTELYTASNYTIDTGTRTHGNVTVKEPLINWLAGTTESDLREIMSTHLMRSGFTARTCFIWGKNNFGKRCMDITYPEDYEEVFQHICVRLWMLQKANGAFAITKTAKVEATIWYDTRPEPEEELLFAAWNRNKELFYKFAMILCLADGGPMVINHKHVVRAIGMVDMVNACGDKLIRAASESSSTMPLNDITRYIQRKKKVSHTELIRYFRSSRGFSAKVVRSGMLDLIQDGCVKVGLGAKGGKTYYWRGYD